MKKYCLILLLLALFSLPVSAKYEYDYDSMEVQEVSSELEDKIENTTNFIEEAISQKKSSAAISDLYWCRGAFYKQNKEYSNALKDLNTALKYYPNNIKALRELVITKMDLGDYNGAIVEINKLIKLNPKNAENMFMKANIYYKMKKYQNAIDYYTKAIVLKPKYPEAFQLRGLTEIINNQQEKGMQDLQYAKQQYYDLGEFDEYQKVVNRINEFKRLKIKE